MYMPSTDHAAMVSGMAQQAQFKVEMNSMLFHSVINGIYADKIRSPFRELATNARDGHAAAGKLDVPFDITLPSMLNPVLTIRDYGCSLSHDDVMGLYSTMFASSKRASNEAVGMIGLGSKSPFAYTNIFNVSCWLDGIRRQYSCFIGEDDVPNIVLVAQEPSDAPNGVEVSFAVDPADVRKFRDVAPEVLFGFDPKPNILNETYEFKQPVILYEGDGWKIYDKTSTPFTSLMARQGCVLYPISAAALGMSNEPLFTWACVIDFPIGELSVATSREALGYDTKTRGNVTRRIRETREKITALVAVEVAEQKTYLDACVHVEHQLQQGAPKRAIYELVKANLRWQGQTIKTSFRLTETLTDDRRVALVSSQYHKMGTLKPSISHRPSISLGSFLASYVRDRLEIYYEPADTQLGPSRMRNVILENTDGKDILWVRANPSEVTEIQSELGGREPIDLTTVAPIQSTKRTKAELGTRTLRYIAPTGYFNRYGTTGAAVQERVLLAPDLLYIEQKGSHFKIQDSFIGLESAYERIRTLIAHKVLDEGTKVYCLNQINKTVLDDHPMTPLLDHVVGILKKKLKSEVFGAEDRYRITARKQRVELLKTLAKGRKLPTKLTDYVKWVETYEAEAAKQPPTASSSMEAIYQTYVPVEYAAKKSTSNTGASQDANLADEYPLLNSIIGSNYMDTGVREKQFNHYLELISK